MAEKTQRKIASKKLISKSIKSTKPRKQTKTLSTFKEATITPPRQRSLKVKRSYILTLLGIFVVVAILFLGRNLLVAALVNGQPISRLSVVRELEKQGGKQALDSLVTKQLIIQEARKKNITVSQKEIDDELKAIQTNLEKQGQKLDQVLALQGMTKEQLVEQIKLQKMLEKMVGKIEVTDKEIDDYLNENKDSLPQDQDDKTLKENIKKSLLQQKLNEKAQALFENLRKSAKINYFVNY